MLLIEYEGCAWELRPVDWAPDQGDVRIRKASLIMTNQPELELLRRRCADAGPYVHVHSIGDAHGPRVAHPSGAHSSPFAKVFAQVSHRTLLKGFLPEPVELPPLQRQWLFDDPMTDKKGLQVKVTAGDAPVMTQIQFPERTRIRPHLLPRRELFDPSSSDEEVEESGGPNSRGLTFGRVTHFMYEGSAAGNACERWTDPAVVQRILEKELTGHTVFLKRSANKTATAESSSAALELGAVALADAGQALLSVNLSDLVVELREGQW